MVGYAPRDVQITLWQSLVGPTLVPKSLQASLPRIQQLQQQEHTEDTAPEPTYEEAKQLQHWTVFPQQSAGQHIHWRILCRSLVPPSQHHFHWRISAFTPIIHQ